MQTNPKKRKPSRRSTVKVLQSTIEPPGNGTLYEDLGACVYHMLVHHLDDPSRLSVGNYRVHLEEGYEDQQNWPRLAIWRPPNEQEGSGVQTGHVANSADVEDVPPDPTPSTLNSPDPNDAERQWHVHDHPHAVKALRAFEGFGSRIIGEAIEELQKLHDRKASIEREAAKTEDLGRAFWDAVDSVEGPARVRKINAALEVLGSTKRMVGDGQVVDLKPAK